MDKLTPPFTVKEGSESYWVEDANGYRFGFCYFSETPTVGTGRAERLSRAVARRLATQIARLPELLKRG